MEIIWKLFGNISRKKSLYKREVFFVDIMYTYIRYHIMLLKIKINDGHNSE